ncbi:MAG: 2-C-methyl-D-erythritol 4-phosphate cytidylyltransferase [Burkholderiales bacterium]|nr:2-C-methyl-D-erythritol 4-phosphate cytidylyltransferase [Bacteroidia bacterium]
MNSHYNVIIVAGGTGSRMQSTVPKQFIEIKGKPILIHTIEKFIEFDEFINIIVCVHKNYMSDANFMMAEYFPQRNIKMVTGGDTRFYSVKNGLNCITNMNDVVGIHDAARPFVSVETIKRCFETAAQKGNAIPVSPVFESLRMVTNGINKAVSRDDFKVVQTPQCFIVSKIKDAFEQDYSPFFTDDATVLEGIDEPIFMVEGNVENIKITNPTDLKFAELYL